MPLKECIVEIQTYVFQLDIPFCTVNYLVNNFSENIDVSKLKFNSIE